MADYIGISKPLAIVGVTPKPEVNYFYGPWGSVAEALNNIPQLARTKGLTVGIIEGSEIVEYWFKNGVDLVLKSVDPTLVYTTDETQQIINGLENIYVQKEIGKELIPSTSLTKLNQLPTKESNDNTYVAKESGKSLIENTKIVKLDALPSSVFSQAEVQRIIDNLDNKISAKVTAVPNQRLITEEEAIKLAYAITGTTFEEELSKKVDTVPGAGLITDLERTSIANAVDSTTLSIELAKKVDIVNGERLITNVEALKIASAVVSTDLEAYLLKDTNELEEVMEIPKEEGYFIRFFYETDSTEKKISMTNLILDVSNFIHPTYRSLVGIQNGSNTQFKYSGTLIQETAELYIGGLIYPVNIGFTFEGDTIIITGAPIPTAEDIMRLKAIYLT